MANETHPADARNGTEGQDVLLDFGRESLAHLHNVALRLLLVCLRQQDNGVRMLQRDLIFKQTHVVVIALEPVHHDEEVHTDEPVLASH